MKALKKIDASYTAIEKLPDSITHLKQLAELKLIYCEKLRKIPEQIGNMEGLRTFNASGTAIEQLPDSFGGLVNLERLELKDCQNLRNLPNSIWKLKLLKTLDLWMCSKLERLPGQLGKMQCLERLNASYTAIEEVPDSIGLLSRLLGLDLSECKKLKCVPESIWNLTSIQNLTLHPGDYKSIISLPDSVKKMKEIKVLHLSCNVRLCLPMILCFSSLETLTLTDEGQILSLAKPFSLYKLFNLQRLTLDNCTTLGSSLPELPLNLRELYIYNHNSLEQLPDLSSLRKLKYLNMSRCISLRSISLLPSHLRSLYVEECASLQDLPDLSMLKELIYLIFTRCRNLKSVSLKQSSLKVRPLPYRSFKAHLPNREVAEWFNNKNSGHRVSFDIPPCFGSNFLGLALWFVFTCKAKENLKFMRAVITNDTESITENYTILVKHTVVNEAQSRVECITGEKLSMKSEDRIKVSIGSLLYSDYELKVPVEEVKVKMCGVHVIQNRPSTSV